MQKVVITMDDKFNHGHCHEYAEVEITDQELKTKQTRMVTMDSLLRAISKSVIFEAEPVQLGKIPFGYFDAMVKMERGKFCADIVTVLPAGRQLMQYEQTRYDVCVPSLVFYIHICEERVGKTKVFAIKDKRPTEKSHLYRYPFGNVNSGSGDVCWGSNTLSEIKELKGVERIMTLFIQSPCNNDLYNSKNCVGVKDLPLRQLMEELKCKETFPEEYLMPIKNSRKAVTLKELLTWKIGGRCYE